MHVVSQSAHEVGGARVVLRRRRNEELLEEGVIVDKKVDMHAMFIFLGLANYRLLSAGRRSFLEREGKGKGRVRVRSLLKMRLHDEQATTMTCIVRCVRFGCVFLLSALCLSESCLWLFESANNRAPLTFLIFRAA